MNDRHVLEPILWALVAFALTIGAAMLWSTSLNGEAEGGSAVPVQRNSHNNDAIPRLASATDHLPATPTGGPPSPDARPSAIPTFENSQSSLTRGAMLRMAVLSAANESQEVGRAVHNLLARPAD